MFRACWGFLKGIFEGISLIFKASTEVLEVVNEELDNFNQSFYWKGSFTELLDEMIANDWLFKKVPKSTISTALKSFQVYYSYENFDVEYIKYKNIYFEISPYNNEYSKVILKGEKEPYDIIPLEWIKNFKP